MDKLRELSDSDLVAYWNILVATAGISRLGWMRARHIEYVDLLLDERNIPHCDGKPIPTVRVRVAA